MKVVNLYKIEKISENEFTKHFRYAEKEMDLYLSKAYDDETDKHYVVASIPAIPSLSVNHIQYPIQFEDNQSRDDYFNDFNALEFLDSLYDQIKNQVDSAKENNEDIQSEEI
jgi:hypothetical protein